MNWFQRYGIPGAYFVGLGLVWAYAFYDKMSFEQIKIFFAIATITFLPTGYIISVLSQWIYLSIKSCGIHKKALNKAKKKFRFNFSYFDLPGNPKDEAMIEAYSTILVTFKGKELGLNFKEEDWTWIKKRMDILAINLSLIVATILAFLSALVFWSFHYLPRQTRLFNWKMIIPIVISIFISIVMYCSRKKISKQIIPVITEIYKFFTLLKKK